MPLDAGKITVKVSLDLAAMRELIDVLGLTAEQVAKLAEYYFAMPEKPAVWGSSVTVRGA